jgi:hypothetical protein
VFDADLATNDHISHWVLQGVCLVLNTDWKLNTNKKIFICLILSSPKLFIRIIV